MKIQLLILVSILVINASCKKECEGNRCCNPNTSKVVISDYSKSWTPFHDGESTELISENLSMITFKENIRIVDSTYWEGDECPSRPGEYIFCHLTNGNDNICIRTSRYTSAIKVDSIQFYICAGPCQNVGSINQLTTVELMKNVELFGNRYEEVVHAESTQGGITELYLAKDVGVIAIEKNQVFYQLK
jgi:hypothetical protein